MEFALTFSTFGDLIKNAGKLDITTVAEGEAFATTKPIAAPTDEADENTQQLLLHQMQVVCLHLQLQLNTWVYVCVP